MKRVVVVVAILAACESPPVHKLPSASIAPHLARMPPRACGYDVSVDDTLAVRYRYTYDDLGRLAKATGTYTGFGGEDSIVYDWDNLDRMVHLVQTHDWDPARAEIAAHYNTLGDLLEYTWNDSQTTERYTYEGFSDTGQPARQLISQPRGAHVAFQLDYDAAGRIAVVVPEGGGAATVYTYDDDGRTITIDTDHGAFRGTMIYDDQGRELSETWGGTDPSAVASEQTFDWGAQLRSVTYRSGTATAPHDLGVLEVDTYRYDDCSPPLAVAH